MSDTPFLGELRLLSFSFAPRGWALCNNQLLPINQNQALFSLLGTMYGGDGEVNFALPDLRGRVPIHMGGGWTQGQRFGEEFHRLTANELPQHTHALNASRLPTDQATPALLGSVENAYRSIGANPSPGDVTTLHPATLATAGGSQLHENRPPSLVLTWCIALIGIFPSAS
ncbi:phage tail protein [Conexibacter woesei]|uniref:Tail Collar domain protein n=1 Tax=Conexibacter woesei (strain DSM 14684 / CCUG 47730 / CIP 108061 / JCM 11494 / NBRC 100937 / ID131577) TaxID=469383 RepID=D3F8R4_CONWI|nr:tail fiber protein [Conexibacter woesei]ADB51028.1 Tail Collar domain protein [Conexibacter woesei DSM 14684]